MAEKEDWQTIWGRATNEQLANAAHDYWWLVHHTNLTDTTPLEQILAEAERRGGRQILEKALSHPPAKIRKTRGAAGRRWPAKRVS